MADHTTPTNPAPKPGDRVRVNDGGTHHDAVGNVLHREDDVMLVVKLDGIAGKWLYADDELDVLPAVPATQDDLREQAGAAVMALLKRLPLAPPDQFGGLVGRLGATERDVADAVLTVVNPVLEGLRAEIERAEDESVQLRRQVIDERVQATRTAQELFAKWRGERDQARAERDALSSLLRGMARRVGEVREEMRFATKHVDGWRKRADRLMSQRDKARAEIEQLRARPSVSDQTPATPDDVVQSAVVADLRERAERYRDRCVGKPSDGAHAFAAQVLDHLAMGYEIALPEPTAPSSVRGDTTPTAPDGDELAREYMCRDCGHPKGPFDQDDTWQCDRHRAPSEDTTGGQQ